MHESRYQKLPTELHSGTCHCQRVKFRIRAPTELKAVDIPSKVRFPRITVPCQNFESLTDESILSFYAVTSPDEISDQDKETPTDTAIYTFCSYCGVNILYSPSINPVELMVNADCIDRSKVRSYVVSYHSCHETIPSVSSTSEIFRGCNRRGSGVENSAFNSPVPPATTHAQVRQHTVAGACSFPSPVPVLHAVTPRKDSPTSSLSPSCKSTRKYNTNGNHSKGSFDAHVKAAGASASYLTTPSTASPSTDVSGHTTSSTGRSSVNSSGNESSSYSDQRHDQCIFFHNWPLHSEETSRNIINNNDNGCGHGHSHGECSNQGSDISYSANVNKLEGIRRELPIKYQQMFAGISPLKGKRLGARSIDSTNVLLGTPMHRQLQYHLKAHLKPEQTQVTVNRIIHETSNSVDCVQNVCV